jgi:hypothetical protein
MEGMTFCLNASEELALINVAVAMHTREQSSNRFMAGLGVS